MHIYKQFDTRITTTLSHKNKRCEPAVPTSELRGCAQVLHGCSSAQAPVTAVFNKIYILPFSMPVICLESLLGKTSAVLMKGYVVSS